MLPADLPDALRPQDLSVYLEVPATGVQIYRCEQNASEDWVWAHKGPDALLFDLAKTPIGKHYGGPTWEAHDGSKIVGAPKASAQSPSGAIPWLLLDIKSRDGNGLFTPARAILRIATTGGLAPQAAGEDQAGREERVPYTATYLFLK